MAHFVNGPRLIALAHAHMPRFAAQARAIAIGACMVTAHARQIFSHHAGIGFFETSREVGDDALKRMLLADAFAL